MKINLSKEIRSPLGEAVINLMTEKSSDVFEHFGIPSKEPGDKFVELECKINGIEVDLGKFLDLYNDSYNQNVKEEAKQLIKSKCNDVSYTLDLIVENIKNTAYKNLQIEPNEDD